MPCTILYAAKFRGKWANRIRKSYAVEAERLWQLYGDLEGWIFQRIFSVFTKYRRSWCNDERKRKSTKNIETHRLNLYKQLLT